MVEGLKWLKSKRRTMEAKAGYSVMVARNLRKMRECGMVMCRYRVLRVAAWIDREVRRRAIKSAFRVVRPFGGISTTRRSIMSPRDQRVSMGPYDRGVAGPNRVPGLG